MTPIEEQKDGILVVDKPAGPTSHDVVARVRRELSVKAGHTGTLDPLATGVLPVVIGQATRLARFYQGSDKSYRAVVRLGRSTDTYDSAGRVVEEHPVPVIDEGRIEETLSRYLGEIEQRAPLYSAIKIRGRKLYEYARRGHEIEPPLRRVTIHQIRLLERDSETWTIELNCSAGTYVRSLAHDIGVRLGCGAHIQGLQRTRSGPFDLAHSVSLDDVSSRWQEAFVPLNQLLPELPAVDLGADEARRVLHGNELVHPNLANGTCRLFFEERLLALAESDGVVLKPKTVFSA